MKKILVIASVIVIIAGAVLLYLHTANTRNERLTIQLENEPDLTLQGVTVRAFTTAGALVYELAAQQVYQHSNTGTINFDQLNIVAQHLDRVSWHMAANLGSIRPNTHQKLNELSPIQLSHGVHVYSVVDEQILQSFTSETLTYLPEENRLLGSGSITIKDNDQYYVADSLDIDLTKQEFNLSSLPGHTVELLHDDPKQTQ